MQLQLERELDVHHHLWWFRVEALATHNGWTADGMGYEPSVCESRVMYPEATALALKEALERGIAEIPEAPIERKPSCALYDIEDIKWGLAGTRDKLARLIRFLDGGEFVLCNTSASPLDDDSEILRNALERAQQGAATQTNRSLLKEGIEGVPLSSAMGDRFMHALYAVCRAQELAITCGAQDLARGLDEARRVLFSQLHLID